MPVWLLNPSFLRYMGIALAGLALFGIGYFKGHRSVQEKFDQYKAEVVAIAAAQEEKTKAIEAKNQRLNEETKNAFNNQLANLRAYYGMRNKGSGTVSGLPDPAFRVNDYSPDNLPPTPILASQCAETTLNLLVLQNWVRGVVQSSQ